MLFLQQISANGIPITVIQKNQKSNHLPMNSCRTIFDIGYSPGCYAAGLAGGFQRDGFLNARWACSTSFPRVQIISTSEVPKPC